MSYCPPTPQWQLRQVVKTLERIASELTDQGFADAIQSHADDLDALARIITPAARPDMLTPSQARVLVFIRQYIDETGHAPTRKEIADAFGYTSANGAQEHVKSLERKGVITLTGGARGIRINKRTVATPDSNPTNTSPVT